MTTTNNWNESVVLRVMFFIAASFFDSDRAKTYGLLWNNPRFPNLTYDTEDLALQHTEFRILKLIDPTTNEFICDLEHEIRAASHPSFCAKNWLGSKDEKWFLPLLVGDKLSLGPCSSEVCWSMHRKRGRQCGCCRHFEPLIILGCLESCVFCMHLSKNIHITIKVPCSPAELHDSSLEENQQWQSAMKDSHDIISLGPNPHILERQFLIKKRVWKMSFLRSKSKPFSQKKTSRRLREFHL